LEPEPEEKIAIEKFRIETKIKRKRAKQLSKKNKIKNWA
jgi:hypothetical protein